MASIKRRRYDMFLADLNPTLGAEISKIRPVIIVSRDELSRHLQTVTV